MDSRSTRGLLVLFAVGLVGSSAFSAAEVRKAVGSIELADAVGDVTPITSSEAEYPGFDIVKLAPGERRQDTRRRRDAQGRPRRLRELRGRALLRYRQQRPDRSRSRLHQGPGLRVHSGDPGVRGLHRRRFGLHRRLVEGQGQAALGGGQPRALQERREVRQGDDRRLDGISGQQGVGADADPRHGGAGRDRLCRPQGEVRPDDPHPGQGVLRLSGGRTTVCSRRCSSP